MDICPVYFSEFLPGEIGNRLDGYFKDNGWELQAWQDDKCIGYQVFFGKDVQVDNLYEYGFPYLYDKDELVSFSRDFFDKHIQPIPNEEHKSLYEQIHAAETKTSLLDEKINDTISRDRTFNELDKVAVR